MNMNGVRYCYFGRKINQCYGPVITAVSRLVIKEGIITVQFATSFCSPKDRFVKAEGRKLALANLADGAFNEVPFRSRSDLTIGNWLETNRKDLPSKFRKLEMYHGINEFDTNEFDTNEFDTDVYDDVDYEKVREALLR